MSWSDVGSDNSLNQMELVRSVHLVPERRRMAGAVQQTVATLGRLFRTMEHVELVKTIQGQWLVRQEASAAAVAHPLARATRCFGETAPVGNVKSIKSSEARLAWMLAVIVLGRSFEKMEHARPVHHSRDLKVLIGVPQIHVQRANAFSTLVTARLAHKTPEPM